MTPRTLKALRGSIEKWQKIVIGKGTDYGYRNCPLCKEFLNRDAIYDRQCDGCPVVNVTRKSSCIGTPYDDEWIDLAEVHNICELGQKAITHAQRKAALSELLFLESLLPKRTRK